MNRRATDPVDLGENMHVIHNREFSLWWGGEPIMPKYIVVVLEGFPNKNRGENIEHFVRENTHHFKPWFSAGSSLGQFAIIYWEWRVNLGLLDTTSNAMHPAIFRVRVLFLGRETVSISVHKFLNIHWCHSWSVFPHIPEYQYEYPWILIPTDH